MTDPKIDPEGVTPERLAALLDGRLDERERAEVLRALGADEELRAIYADAVAIEAELARESAAATTAGVATTATPADADVRPFRPAVAPTSWRSGRRMMLLAAGLAGVVLLPWAVARSRGDAVEPYALVEQIDVERSATIPAEPWAVTRGGAAAVSERGRAVRLGARLVDLEVAIAAGDSGMRAAVASSVVRLATMDPPLTGAPVDLYRRIMAGDVGDRGAREEGWEAMSELAGEEAMRLGAWLEAARVAAARRDAEFFESGATRRVLGSPVSADAEERAAMERVRSAVASPDSMDWAGLAAALDEVLRVAGR